MNVSTQYQQLIKTAANQNNVPYNLLAALLYQESGFNPRASLVNTNGSRDRGMAEINDRAFPDVSDAQAFDPNFAIPWAARHLRNLYNQYGNWWDVLLAYNGGGGAVIASKAGKPYNAPYAQKIFELSNIDIMAKNCQAIIGALGSLYVLDMEPGAKEYYHELADIFRRKMGWKTQ